MLVYEMGRRKGEKLEGMKVKMLATLKVKRLEREWVVRLAPDIDENPIGLNRIT